MKLTKIDHVQDFLAAVDKCEGEVVLTSLYGDKYNLKSALSQYIAIGALLGYRGDELELWCYNKDDERHFLQFFSQHPEAV